MDFWLNLKKKTAALFERDSNRIRLIAWRDRITKVLLFLDNHFLKIVSVVFLFLILFSTLYFFSWRSPKPFPEQSLVTVERGKSLSQIADLFKQKGIIRSAPWLRTFITIMGGEKKVIAGDYYFPSAVSVFKVAKMIHNGEFGLIAMKITIPEGFDAEQIYQKLSGVTEVNLTDLKEHEGYLFPDTYEIPYGAASQKIVKIMTDNFDKKTAGLESEIAKQGKTLNDIVIMASLLEREVKTKEEKELAAGLLWKRLRAGMPLQVDAAPETYKTRGLPGKPIGNPGLVSITAAVYPKASQYWYYLSTPEGKTIFSKTLEEHNIAKAKYPQ